MLAGQQHGMMFNARSDDVISGRDQTGDRQIVRFCASACENDLLRLSPE
jgi:hypothetical protein